MLRRKKQALSTFSASAWDVFRNCNYNDRANDKQDVVRRPDERTRAGLGTGGLPVYLLRRERHGMVQVIIES